MPKFRKRPIEIEAIQFTGNNIAEIWDAFGTDGIHKPAGGDPDHPPVLILTTTHGDPAPCRPGDWVIPDSRLGTFYPCKPDVFAATCDDAATAEPCGFHAHNPLSGKLAQCIDAAEATVIVAATAPGGTFNGDGVETKACAVHGKRLVDMYGAVLVPAED